MRAVSGGGPAAHTSDDVDTRPLDGWFTARCVCGFTAGPLPDLETTMDVLMEHAYEMGRAGA